MFVIELVYISNADDRPTKTNTVLSRIAVGEASDPAGYTQPSIVTVRLWKHR